MGYLSISASIVERFLLFPVIIPIGRSMGFDARAAAAPISATPANAFRAIAWQLSQRNSIIIFLFSYPGKNFRSIHFNYKLCLTISKIQLSDSYFNGQISMTSSPNSDENFAYEMCFRKLHRRSFYLLSL